MSFDYSTTEINFGTADDQQWAGNYSLSCNTFCGTLYGCVSNQRTIKDRDYCLLDVVSFDYSTAEIPSFIHEEILLEQTLCTWSPQVNHGALWSKTSETNLPICRHIKDNRSRLTTLRQQVNLAKENPAYTVSVVMGSLPLNRLSVHLPLSWLEQNVESL